MIREYLFQPFNRNKYLQHVGGRKHRRYLVILIIIIPVFVLAKIYGYDSWVEKERLPSKKVSAKRMPQASLEENPSTASLRVIEGKIKTKGTLYDALIAEKVTHDIISIIISKLSPIIDFEKCHPEDQFTMWVTDGGKLVKFTYQRSPLDIYEVQREGDQYIGYKKEVPVDRYLVKVCGKIQSSLFEAVNEISERDELAMDFADIFVWGIDFFKDLQAGDQFKIIVEKVFKGDKFITYGKILAAEYRMGSKVCRGFYFEGSDGRGDYFNEKGHSLKRAFLRTPLRYSRISSRYTRSRRHPILGGRHPHYGIDYAAPQGTPIWSVADGKVVQKGWNRAYGRHLAIRHPNGYRTYYGHLSKFAHGIRKGVRVRQKQIIGYVGSTGYATGPHLDYRLKRYGRYRNPLKAKFPSGRPVPKSDLKHYMETEEGLLKILEDETFTKQDINSQESSRVRSRGGS